MRARFEKLLPGRFFLDANDQSGLQAWLLDKGHLEGGEDIMRLQPAGEGNMNLTLRVKTERRSFILKQARPWVEKYPSIEAPSERSDVEAAFYAVTANMPEVSRRSPGVLFHESADRILALEDLGDATDFTDIYQRGRVSDAELSELAAYLTELHSQGVPSRPVLRNRRMRALNHEHIFALPLRPDNGLDLDAYCPGLSEAAAPLRADADYVAKVHELGDRYLADGPRLLHGDFYPGSFLRTHHGVRVIDPEFAFLGAPEFDVGVLIAHLILSGEGADSASGRVIDRYQLSQGFRTPLSFRFAGAEIMRRLIGVAQLPIKSDINVRATLLATSHTLVMQGHP